MTVRTPEKEQAILDALTLHPSKTRACRSAKLSRQAFYEWCRDDRDFAARVAAAQEIGIDAVEDTLFSSAMRDDTTAAIFTLKSWRPERYRETTRHELTGASGEPIAIRSISVPLPVEEAAEDDPS